MEVEVRPNPETGSIWAGWIIAKLYRDWPHPRNLFFGEILSETLVSVDVGDGQQSFRYLTEWLRDEGYI